MDKACQKDLQDSYRQVKVSISGRKEAIYTCFFHQEVHVNEMIEFISKYYTEEGSNGSNRLRTKASHWSKNEYAMLSYIMAEPKNSTIVGKICKGVDRHSELDRERIDPGAGEYCTQFNENFVHFEVPFVRDGIADDILFPFDTKYHPFPRCRAPLRDL